MSALIAGGSSTPLSATRSLWGRWVIANAVGELIGLGGTALAALLLLPALSTATNLATTLATAAVFIIAGTVIEGVAVGTAQWLVLRRPLPRLPWRRWVAATAAGAGIAWAAGMVPSTLMALGQDAEQAATGEPRAILVYPLAFLLGLLLGPVLGGAQWLVLRRSVGQAGGWIVANAVAWGGGMVLIFAGIDTLAARGIGPGTIVLAALLLAATGALVGAIHGLALVRIIARRAAGAS